MTMTINSLNSKPFSSIAIMALFMGIIFFLVNMVFWLADDIYYQYIASDCDVYCTEPIRSISDIFISQCKHYVYVNGRFVAHCIVQLFCGILGKPVFAICSAIVYGLLLVLILRAAGTSWKNKYALLSVICLCMLNLIEMFVPSTFVGYFYMLALVLFWLELLKKCRIKISGWKGFFYAIVLFFGSAIVGNGHEAYNLPISIGLFVFLIVYHKQFSWSQKIMILGFWCGILAMALSPGSQARRHEFSFQQAINIFFIVTSNIYCFYLFILTFTVTFAFTFIFIYIIKGYC